MTSIIHPDDYELDEIEIINKEKTIELLTKIWFDVILSINNIKEGVKYVSQNKSWGRNWKSYSE